MSSLAKISAFVFRHGLDTVAPALSALGVKEAAAWAASGVIDHFKSHATELTEALRIANMSAWGALAFSLGDDSALDLFRNADSKELRKQMRSFLETHAPSQHSDAANPEFCRHCLEELNAARKAGLLDDGGIDMADLCRHMGAFAQLANSGEILDAERTALAAVTAEFPANQYPNLRTLLELTPGNGSPFLIVAAEFFFKQQIVANDKLARLVNHDLQTLLLKEQRSGQAMIVEEIHQAADRVLEQLKLHGPLRPADGCSIHNENELRVVRSLLQKFRSLPPQLQEALPDQLNNLGRLAFAAGDFAQARDACSEAASHSPADAAKAAAHYNAYLAALEARDWKGALESIRQAAALNPRRFMPFPFTKFEPIRILGAGGFGVAFLCDHQYLDNKVVVKTLHPAQLARDLKEVFREAAVLESLNHPGIVRVRDAAFSDGTQEHSFLVMDWFDGQSLDDHVAAHGPLPLDQALEMGRQLAQALGAAHQRGILHRDVKPRNVLIGLVGGKVRVKLIDFGLALQQNAVRAATHGNTLLGSSRTGTVDYSAPEQTGKLPGVKIGPYSDVYSWARTMCFALFRTPHPRPKQFQILPTAVCDLLDDCLAEEPQELSKRPATMEALLSRLTVPTVSPPQTAATTLSSASPVQSHLLPPAESKGVRTTSNTASGNTGRTSSASPSRPQPAAPPPHTADLTNSIGMKFVRIEPGEFLMGSPAGEEGRGPYEGADETQHRVRISKPFMMGAHEVTRGQFGAFVDASGHQTEAEKNGWAIAWNGAKLDHMKGASWRKHWFEQDDNHPVVCVGWNDVQAFAQWLAKKEGKAYRLPTEAQWEYACRAGTNTPFHTGPTISTEQANYDGNYTYGQGRKGVYREKTTSVGSFPANPWGLFDMHGNVWEWCNDWYGQYPTGEVTDPAGVERPQKDSWRVLRGGSWRSPPRHCRAACRSRNSPVIRLLNCLGFRLALDYHY